MTSSAEECNLLRRGMAEGSNSTQGVECLSFNNPRSLVCFCAFSWGPRTLFVRTLPTTPLVLPWLTAAQERHNIWPAGFRSSSETSWEKKTRSAEKQTLRVAGSDFLFAADVASPSVWLPNGVSAHSSFHASVLTPCLRPHG